MRIEFVQSKMIFIFLGFQLTLALLQNHTVEKTDRIKKQMGIFTVVKFPNDACRSTTAGRNGTCYTASECNMKG